jgi:hypothetical protein
MYTLVVGELWPRLFGQQDKQWFLDDFLRNIEWDDNSVWGVCPGVLTDFSLSSYSINLVSGTSGYGPKVIAFFLRDLACKQTRKCQRGAPSSSLCFFKLKQETMQGCYIFGWQSLDPFSISVSPSLWMSVSCQSSQCEMRLKYSEWGCTSHHLANYFPY